MQSRFDRHHHLLRRPDTHHHHIPVFLLCPCSCHHQHHHHRHPQLPWTGPHFPPPPRSHLRPPGVPCAEVLPNQSSSRPLHDHRSPWLGDHSTEAAVGVQDGDFSAAGLEDQEWNENQVDVGDYDDDDVVFVLTDEWREFFAKSEAKRKLAKQQKKKNRK